MRFSDIDISSIIDISVKFLRNGSMFRNSCLNELNKSIQCGEYIFGNAFRRRFSRTLKKAIPARNVRNRLYVLAVKNSCSPSSSRTDRREDRRFRSMQYVLARDILLAFYCYAPYFFRIPSYSWFLERIPQGAFRRCSWSVALFLCAATRK
jgi:hypothetical protein